MNFCQRLPLLMVLNSIRSIILRVMFFKHTVLMLSHLTFKDLTLALAILLHDVGKPQTFFLGDDKIPHFYCHEKVGAEMTEKILRRLKFKNKTIKDVVHLVRTHMTYAHVDKMRTAKWRRPDCRRVISA